MPIEPIPSDAEDYLSNLTGDGTPAAHAVETVQRMTADGSTIVHVLIDPTLRDLRLDPIFNALLADTQEVAWRPIAIKHPSIDPAFVPQMRSLDLSIAKHAMLLRYLFGMAVEDWSPVSLRAGGGHRFCGLFIGSNSLSDLAVQLGKISIHDHPEGGRALVRWYDPSVVEALWRSLDDAQRTSVLPSRSVWIGLGRDLHPVIRRAHSDTTITFRLTRDQWALLDGLRILNPKVARIGARHAGVITPQIRTALHDALIRAGLKGIRDPSDLHAFVDAALRYHPRFDTHPLLRERLSRRKHTESLQESLSLLTDCDWQQVINDLSSTFFDGLSK